MKTNKITLTKFVRKYGNLECLGMVFFLKEGKKIFTLSLCPEENKGGKK